MAQKFQIAIAGTLVAIGLIVLGIFINKGLQSFSNKERVVTVRGLAEKDFKATSSTMKIQISCSGDFPKELTAKTEKATADIVAYLKSIGYEKINQEELYIFDSKTYYEKEWQEETNKYIQVKKDRYRTSKELSFEVKDVEKSDDLERKINLDLINKDLSSNISSIYNIYHFADLNSIKPELIAESTKNARLAGEQFAKDSQSKLGKIKTASQGQIDLLQSSYTQTARVVSSIVFFLED